MAMRVFADIETLPPERDALAHHPKLSGCDETEFRRLALDGDYGRVLVIGIIIERDGRIALSGCLGRDRQTMNFHLEERRTLIGFWKLLKDFDPKRDTIIGHNILSFDLKVIYKRSYINRVQPSLTLSFARYKSQPIFDTMYEWNKWDTRKLISLDELARAEGRSASTLLFSFLYESAFENGVGAFINELLEEVAKRDGHWNVERLEQDASLKIGRLKHVLEQSAWVWSRRILEKLICFGFTPGEK
ncbi:MAG TPA: hypothetical protein VFA21_15310 [Pyrinomonadaceae bacterium]|nr:hypothetical protein [Pyrinomonadaceae bacterium]